MVCYVVVCCVVIVYINGRCGMFLGGIIWWFFSLCMLLKFF